MLNVPPPLFAPPFLALPTLGKASANSLQRRLSFVPGKALAGTAAGLAFHKKVKNMLDIVILVLLNKLKRQTQLINFTKMIIW